MDHVAIMNPKLGLIEKILSGEKKIESRWSKNEIAPWNKIWSGDTVYFKNSGGLVVAKAEVEKVKQFEKADFGEVKKLFKDSDDWSGGKNYCVLIWLKNPQKIEPFKIKKRGRMGWVCADDILNWC